MYLTVLKTKAKSDLSTEILMCFHLSISKLCFKSQNMSHGQQTLDYHFISYVCVTSLTIIHALFFFNIPFTSSLKKVNIFKTYFPPKKVQHLFASVMNFSTYPNIQNNIHPHHLLLTQAVSVLLIYQLPVTICLHNQFIPYNRFIVLR